MLLSVTPYFSASLISAQRQRVFSFLLAQSPKLICLPVLHSAKLLFLSCLKQLSPSLRQTLSACRPQLTPNAGKASETFQPSLSQGGLPASKCLHGVAQVKGLCSIFWHCLSEDSPCVWKFRPLVCPLFLGLLCQGRSPVPSGFCQGMWGVVGSMHVSQGPIKILRGSPHWKDYGAPSHTEFKIKQGTSKHKT